MYYPELGIIASKYGINKEIIGQLDNWLAFLPVRNRDFISPYYFADDAEIEPRLAVDLFNYAFEAGVLLLRFEVTCPRCGEFLGTFEAESIPDSCSYCQEDIEPDLSTEKIRLSYRLVKTPMLFPASEIKKKYLGRPEKANIPACDVVNIRSSQEIFANICLLKGFDRDKYHELLMNYKASHIGSAANQNSVKGTTLEQLSFYLLNCVIPFEVKHSVRTLTNQLENPVKVNPCIIPHPLIGYLVSNGGKLISECKNEAGPIGSKYVQKLAQIMDQHGAKFGVFFSREGFSGQKEDDDAEGVRKIIWFQNQRAIIAITEKDLEAIDKGEAIFLQLLWDKYHDFTMLMKKTWDLQV